MFHEVSAFAARFSARRSKTKSARRPAAHRAVEQLEARQLLSASVVGRYVFYNDSSYDGNNTAINSSDDAAIATDKSALLPGQTAGSGNLTNYTKGINGIMVDISGLPAGNSLTANDFQFRLGTTGDPSTWSAAPQPSAVTVRAGAGSGGSDRVEVTWADASITNEWLQVTLYAGNSGLTQNDVFYLGNKVGDATGDGACDSSDYNSVSSAYGSSAGITNPDDFDRDGTIGFSDLLVASQQDGTSIPMISTAPAQVLGVGTTSTDSQVQISWTPGAGSAASYNIYRGADPSSPGATPLASGVSGTAYTDSTAQNGTTYYYFVEPVSSSSSTGPLSSGVPGNPQATQGGVHYVSYANLYAILNRAEVTASDPNNTMQVQAELRTELTLPGFDSSWGTLTAASVMVSGNTVGNFEMDHTTAQDGATGEVLYNTQATLDNPNLGSAYGYGNSGTTSDAVSFEQSLPGIDPGGHAAAQTYGQNVPPTGFQPGQLKLELYSQVTAQGKAGLVNGQTVDPETVFITDTFGGIFQVSYGYTVP